MFTKPTKYPLLCQRLTVLLHYQTLPESSLGLGAQAKRAFQGHAEKMQEVNQVQFSFCHTNIANVGCPSIDVLLLLDNK